MELTEKENSSPKLPETFAEIQWPFTTEQQPVMPLRPETIGSLQDVMPRPRIMTHPARLRFGSFIPTPGLDKPLGFQEALSEALTPGWRRDAVSSAFSFSFVPDPAEATQQTEPSVQQQVSPAAMSFPVPGGGETPHTGPSDPASPASPAQMNDATPRDHPGKVLNISAPHASPSGPEHAVPAAPEVAGEVTVTTFRRWHVVSLLLINFNCVLMFVAELVLEILFLAHVFQDKVPFRVEFLFLTLLSTLLAVQTLRGAVAGDIDFSANSLIVGGFVEAALIINDCEFLARPNVQEVILTASATRVPFIVLTAVNLGVIVLLYIVLHCRCAQRRTLLKESPCVV